MDVNNKGLNAEISNGAKDIGAIAVNTAIAATTGDPRAATKAASGIASKFGQAIVIAVMALVILFGSLLSAIGVGREIDIRNSGSISSTLSLSAEVLQYQEQVEMAAFNNGMSDYVNLFLAVMMQESGGRAVDVFQCAESMGYGPQGMTGTAITTQQSIEHGVYVLTQRLQTVGVESPTDTKNIALAIQSYNMGAGFIRFAQKNYDGYSETAALAYQQIKSGGVKRSQNIETLGPYAYGDAYYVAHVMRYYSYGAVQNANSTIPSFYQDDYADVPFGTSTIAKSGCGITSFAMVASAISGRTITPKEAVEWCGGRYYVQNAGLSWSYYQAAVTHFNLGVKVIQTANMDTVVEALKQGYPVICSQSAGLFTKGGHMIVLSGINDEGRIFVNDPNKNNAIGKGYNDKSFDMATEIHSTAKQYWIFK